MPVSSRDKQPLNEISESFREIAEILSRMSMKAGETPGESRNRRALGEINESLTQIVAALRTIASGR
jgi:hypothetical protein